MTSGRRVDVQFPYRLDASGRVVTAGYDAHVEQLIEQVLFTNPTERVNRPEFGCGLLQSVFEPVSAEVLTAMESTIQAALSRWLADTVHATKVDIEAVGSQVRVGIDYRILATNVMRSSTFTVPA